MTKKFWIGAAAASVLTVAAVASYFSPLWTMRQIHLAAKENESDRLPDYVDFPALRENLKSVMMASLSRTVDKEEDADNPFAKLGMAFATALLNPMIDAIVSPAGLTSIINKGTPPDLETLANSEAAKTDHTMDASPKFPFGLRYTAWDRALLFRNDQKGDGSFVMRREGLWSWKLVAINIATNVEETTSK